MGADLSTKGQEKGEGEGRTFFEQGPLGFARSSLDGEILEVNGPCCAIVGHPREALIGRRWTETAHPDDAAEMSAALAPLREGLAPSAHHEYRVIKRDGSVAWLSVWVSAAKGPDGGTAELLTVIADATSTRNAEEQRVRLARQEEHARKLESLTILAGGIAHDFNNLLTGMLGSADLALLELGPNHRAREHLDLVRESAERAANLCRQMLAYSGRGRFIVQPVHLSQAIQGMLGLVELSLPKSVTLRCDLAHALPTVEADATQLAQLVLNLAINAAEAIGGKEGVVTVATGSQRCTAEDLENTCLDKDLAPGDYVFVEVSDTGCGMDAETKQKMFDPFFTTKFAGRGLGLAATLGIVRGHRGVIKVWSEVNQGTRVKILLPASHRGAPRREAPRSTMPEFSGVVLVCDDEALVRNTGQKMLERLGFEVLVAADGAEGLEVFRTHHDRIDLVVLDVAMPKLTGEEVLQEIRRISPSARVILTSGNNDQDATDRFVGKGLAGFIRKPFSLKAVRQRVEEALACK